MKEENQNIHAVLILQIIGKPEKFLMDTLNDIIAKMGQEPGVVLKSKNVREPKKMEESTGIAKSSEGKLDIKEQKDFYISFAELEIETDTLLHFVYLMFKYMPAHVEIITPETISVTNHSWNEVLNELIIKLHGYDEIARVFQVEKAILENKLRSLMETQNIKKSKGPKKTKSKK